MSKNKKLQNLPITGTVSLDPEAQTIALCLNLPTAVRVLYGKTQVITDDAPYPYDCDLVTGVAKRGPAVIAATASVPVTVHEVSPSGQSITTDDTARAIIEAGDIRNQRQWKRWVMGQMFNMLVNHEYVQGGADEGFITHRRVVRDSNGHVVYKTAGLYDNLRTTSIDRSFEILRDKLVEQKMMHKHNDDACYLEDGIDYNKSLTTRMIDDYIDKLRKYIDSLPVRKYKKRQYVYIPNGWYVTEGNKAVKKNYKGTYVDDLATIYLRYQGMSNNVKLAKGIDSIVAVVDTFIKYMIPIRTWERNRDGKWGFTYPEAKEFKNAYVSYGCYHTLKNLIRYHGLLLHKDGFEMDREESLRVLHQWHVTYRQEGYKLLRILLDELEANNFDIEADMATWKPRHSRYSY